MAVHVLDIPAFRLAFPAFADVAAYPDARLDVVWGLAVGYFGDVDGVLLAGAAKQSALNFMTAHLLHLSTLTQPGGSGGTVGGASGGVLTDATIDKIRVSFAPPPFKSGWEWWLAQSPYGAQLWALLKVRSAGGFYVPGNPERNAFRRVGGGFGPPGWGRK